MKILISSTITLRPPSSTCATFAVSTSLLLNASSILLLPRSAASLLQVKITCPSPSFTLRTFTSIVSPGFATVVKSTLGSLVYSFLVKIPSHLQPMLRTISSGLTSMTVPSTTSPVCIVFNDSSNICSKVNSDIILNLLDNIVRGGSPRRNTH